MTINIGSLCVRHSRERPDAPAVTDGRVRLTYAELERWSAAFAHRLCAAGLEPGQPVAVIVPKSVSTLVAILGALRAGGFYVPIDPKSPARRLDGILDNCRPAIIVAASDYADAASRHQARLIAPPDMKAEVPADHAPPAHIDREVGREVGPDDDAYVLYTSGSTGEPKGVRISHRSVAAFFDAVAPIMDEDETSRCLNTSPFHFDVSILDTLFPLSRGASVYLTGDIPFPSLTLSYIEKHRLTHMCGVSSTLKLLVSDPTFAKRDISSMRVIMTGAEVLCIKSVQALLAASPGARVINGYGPTEATCVCLAEVITKREPDREEPYPIGHPLEGVHAALLAEDGTVAPAGERGELIVAGEQVMLGYLRRDEETRARLIDIDGRVYYRTGDICSRTEDGTYLFHGRVDEEVKVRGYRIHTNEIRRAILRDAQVSDAVVSVVDSEPFGASLAAAVLAPAGEDVLARLRDSLKVELPAYMMPRFLISYDAFPRLPSGKVDVSTIRANIAREVTGGHEHVMVVG